MNLLVYAIPAAGILGLAFSGYRYQWVARQDPGSAKMQVISDRIRHGAMAFLKAEYSVMLGFLLVTTGLMFLSGMAKDSHPLVALSFAAGALFSSLKYSAAASFPVFTGASSACPCDVSKVNAATDSNKMCLILST